MPPPTDEAAAHAVDASADGAGEDVAAAVAVADWDAAESVSWRGNQHVNPSLVALPDDDESVHQVRKQQQQPRPQQPPPPQPLL